MIREIFLNNDLVTRVSDVDYDRIMRFSTGWYASNNNASKKWYVRTIEPKLDGKRTTFYLHRVICDPPETYKVDHEDGDGLHNERGNLRVTTFYQNNTNRAGWSLSGFKGVSKHKGLFRTRVTIEGEETCLGYFKDPVEAARVYDKAAFELHGEFARLNFPAEYPRTQDFPPTEIPF